MQKAIPARCYRATFRNPIIRRHQLRVKIKCDVQVEIYPETRERWRARVLPTRAALDVSGPSPENVKDQVRELYEEQISDWAIYEEQIGQPMPEPPPHRKPPTHIMSATPLPRQKSVRAVCGKLVRRNQIVADSTIEQWLEAYHDAGFLAAAGAETLILCGQCRIIVKKAEEEYATERRQT